MSADGTTVVGDSYIAQNVTGWERQAIRWTVETGMVSLGDLPGGASDYSVAYDTNRDGSVVVGMANMIPYPPYNGDAFIWDAVHGMRNLQDVLFNEYGIDLNGWRLASASGISDDGSVITGTGWDPNGHSEAWLVELTRPLVTVRVEDGRGGFDEQTFTIEVMTAPDVDLTLSEVDQHTLVFDGQQLTVSGMISATIENLGSQSVRDPFDVLFFEDRNDNSSFDSGVDNVLGTATVAASLAAGAKTTVTASLDGPILFSGNRIWAFADSRLAIPEANEDNNLRVGSCSIGCECGQCQAAADLTASYVRVSQEGQDFTYTARIGNGGSVLAPAGINVAFYDGDPRQGGVLRGVIETSKELQPGQYEDVSLNAAGPFFAEVWVVADDGFSQAGSFEFSSFDVPGADKTVGYGINSSGQIVGNAYFGGTGLSNGLPFLWSDRQYSFFNVPGAVLTELNDISDDGKIVGNWRDNSGFFGFLTTTQAFGTIVDIEVPGAANSTVPWGIDVAGNIVGFYIGSDGNSRHGFLRNTDGSYTTIDYPGARTRGFAGTTTSARLLGGGTTKTLGSSSLVLTRGFVMRMASSRVSMSRTPRARVRTTSTTPARSSAFIETWLAFTMDSCATYLAS